MYKKNIFLFLLSIILLPNLNLAAKDKHPIKYLSLSVGVYRDVPVPKSGKTFSKGGTYRSLLSLQYNPKRKLLRLYPKKTGVGTLFVKNPKTGDVIYEFRIDIKKTNLHKAAKDIQSLLKDIEGISIKIINNTVIVDGEILIPTDMNRILSVINQYPEQSTSLVTLSPLAQNKISKLIERAINNPEVHVRAINGKFLLEGVVTSVADKRRAFLLAQTYVPDIILNEGDGQKVQKRKTLDIIDLIIVKIPPKPVERKKLIQLVFHYVELNKDYAKGFAFSWRPSLSSDTKLSLETGRNTASILKATISNLLPKLNWAKEHGHARVLKSLSIVTENGVEGALNSQSSIPYLTGTGDSISTSFVTVGLKSSVTPTIISSASSSIQLQINFEVNSLVSQSSDGPLTAGHNIKTSLVVKNGHSAAMAGLITNESGTFYNKLPSGSVKNPIIPLHASKSFQRKQSQFVVFITPLIKSSASAGSDKIRKKFNLKQ
ncbi:MAG: type II and III secretion system protein [Bdellovibrionales bacterium]|nr:type II and III secretion system protein [Bdellovibrionales bacterium]